MSCCSCNSCCGGCCRAWKPRNPFEIPCCVLMVGYRPLPSAYCCGGCYEPPKPMDFSFFNKR